MKNTPPNLSKSETGRHLVDILKYSSPRNPLRHKGSTGLFGRPAVDMGVTCVMRDRVVFYVERNHGKGVITYERITAAKSGAVFADLFVFGLVHRGAVLRCDPAEILQPGFFDSAVFDLLRGGV